MELSPYLNFSGNCAEAFHFYEHVLGGKIVTMQTHGQTAMRDQTPAEWHDKIVHVHLAIGNQALMGSDAPGDYFKKAQGFSVSLSYKDATEAERVFTALSEGGTVTMPFTATFWSAGFGALVDRFGTPWMVNTEQAAPPVG